MAELHERDFLQHRPSGLCDRSEVIGSIPAELLEPTLLPMLLQEEMRQRTKADIDENKYGAADVSGSGRGGFGTYSERQRRNTYLVSGHHHKLNFYGNNRIVVDSCAGNAHRSLSAVLLPSLTVVSAPYDVNPRRIAIGPAEDEYDDI